MNRFISVGLSIAVAPVILLAIAKVTGPDDLIKISEVASFSVAIPLGAALVAIGLVLAKARRIAPQLATSQMPARGWEILRKAVRTRFPEWKHALRRRPGESSAWLIISVVLGGIALILPFESDVREVSPTWWKLLFGWFFILSGETLVWLATPLLLACWIALGIRKSNGAMVLASSALGVALPFLYGPVLTYGWGDGIRHLPQTPEIGYFMALGAIATALLGGVRMTRSKEVPEVSLPIVVFCLVAIIGPVSMVGIGKLQREEAKAADDRHHEEARKARELENFARGLTRSWTRQRLPGSSLNDIPHAPPGVTPAMLEVKRRGQKAEVSNKLPEPVQVEMWVTHALPTGSKVICNFSRPEGTPYPGGVLYGLGPKIMPGETAFLEVRAPAFDFRETCARRAGSGALEFAVRSENKSRVLFLSDTAFGPAPPPHAEWIIEYRPW